MTLLRMKVGIIIIIRENRYKMGLWGVEEKHLIVRTISDERADHTDLSASLMK